MSNSIEAKEHPQQWNLSYNKMFQKAMSADLVAIDHQMVCGGEWFKHNHPAGVGSSLKQRVSQLRDVHVHLVCVLNQI